VSYTVFPVTTPTLITLVDPSGMPFARWTLQGSAPEGRILRWKAEGNLHMAGSALDFARSWHHRGFRLEMVIRWNVGVQCLRQDWTGSAWGDPEPLPTALAHSQILRWAARATVVVQPFQGDDSFIFNAHAPGDGPSLRDLAGVAHTHLEMTLEAVSLASAPEVPGTIDPEARTGWSYGAWGYYTWDSARLPGSVSGNHIYNLKLVNLPGYPAGSWTAEIQRRDLTDRVNHLFATYARLDQLLAEGNLSTFSGVIVKDDGIYITTVPSKTEGRITCLKSVLYKLVSVGEDLVGTFEKVGEQTVQEGYTIPNWQFESAEGVPMPIFNYTLGKFDTARQDRYITWSDYDGTHVGTNGGQVMTNTILMTPYLPDLAPLKLTDTDSSTNRIIARSTWREDPRIMTDPAAYLSFVQKGFRGIEYHGISGGGFAAPEASDSVPWGGVHLVINGTLIQFGYFSSGSYIQGPNIAHPISFNEECEFAMFWGLATTYTGYDIAALTGSVVDWHYRVGFRERAIVPRATPAFTTGDELVGIWGDSAYVFHRVYYGANTRSYNEYYVVKGDDLAGVHRYSIYSYLSTDGSVFHIEGVEDPTPSLWRDGAKIRDLN